QLYPILLFFFYYRYTFHRDLHSFPTRRSSDLSTASSIIAFRKSSPPCSIVRANSAVVTRMRRTAAMRPTIKKGSGTSACARNETDRKSTRLNSSHVAISYAVFCLKKKSKNNRD